MPERATHVTSARKLRQKLLLTVIAASHRSKREVNSLKQTGTTEQRSQRTAWANAVRSGGVSVRAFRKGGTMCGHCRATLRSLDQECPHLDCYCDHWPSDWADCSRREVHCTDCAHATTREYVEKFDFCDDVLCDHKPGWQGNADAEYGGE